MVNSTSSSNLQQLQLLLKFFSFIDRTHHYMIKLIKNLVNLKRKKEAKKLTEVLYRNVPDKIHAGVSKSILR